LRPISVFLSEGKGFAARTSPRFGVEFKLGHGCLPVNENQDRVNRGRGKQKLWTSPPKKFILAPLINKISLRVNFQPKLNLAEMAMNACHQKVSKAKLPGGPQFPSGGFFI
jgi:hypothetical protein